jgi:PAS domain S-box-containing protein
LLDPVALDPLASTLERVGSHDHLCSIYQTEAERVAVASPFLRIGLGRREKCVYVHDDGAADAIAAKLVAGGVDVDGVIASGALVLKPKGEAYLRGGRFDPERMFAFWHREAAAAKSQGYSGVRGASDTDWVLDKAPGVERWLEYEARLADELARCDCMLLCQYNRARYPPELLLGIIQTHPRVFYDGVVCRNYYHAPAAELLPPGEGARTVRRWLRNIREHAGRELGLRRGQETLERKQADLQHAHRRLEAQFDAVSQLYELSVRLIPQSDLQKLLDQVLDATIRLLKADLGSVHLYNSETRKLELATQRGFGPELVPELRELEPAAYRERLIVEDVRSDPAFVAMRPFAARAGFRALQSTPLFGRRGKLLGVISMHFLAPHRPAEGDLRMAELYSRRTADIIERMRTEDALRLSEERFRLMVEGVTDYAIFMLDPDGVVTTWNTGAERMKGYRADEIVGQHFRVFYPAEAQALRHPEHELKVAVRKGNYEEEGWRIRKDGTSFWASVVITALFDHGRNLVGFGKVTRDVTERRLSEAARDQASVELAEAIARLQSANEQTSDFLAITAHELHSPIAALIGAAELLAEHWDELDRDQRDENFQNLTRSAARTRRLLDELLMASRLEAGQLDVSIETVPLAAVVAEAIAAIPETVEVVGPADIVVRADRLRVVQMLANLLANAIRYGEPPFVVETCLVGSAAEIMVCDAGPGVAEDLQPRLFKKFVRGAGRRDRGTGLGLFIVRELSRRQGGDAWYQRSADGRTCFCFTLPREG